MSDDELVKLMSKLLLKGAKMLGKSCEKCGTPLFEYKGQVFCPKCNMYDKQIQKSATSSEEEKTKEKKSALAENVFKFGIDLDNLYKNIEIEILTNLKKIIQGISVEEDLHKVKEKLLISDMLVGLLLKLKKAGDPQNGRTRS